jgi:GAF domain-containing protein
MTAMTERRDSSVRFAHGSAGQRPDPGVARDLSELARELQAEPSMDALLQRIVEAAVAEISSADYAGISEIDQKQVHTRAATDPVVQEIDHHQYRLGDGPCLTSLRDEVTVRVNDLGSESRWGRFPAAAVDEGVRSMLSVQLFVAGNNLGALNLYAREPGSFDETDESTAMLLATHAAIAMRGSKVEGNLHSALERRDVIGQAKGILMERYKINDSQAFDLLVVASQQTHRKLRDIAEELATTGALPTE